MKRFIYDELKKWKPRPPDILLQQGQFYPGTGLHRAEGHNRISYRSEGRGEREVKISCCMYHPRFQGLQPPWHSLLHEGIQGARLDDKRSPICSEGFHHLIRLLSYLNLKSHASALPTPCPCDSVDEYQLICLNFDRCQ